MNEKCTDIKSNLDKAKKIYRAAVDSVRKLDEGLKKKKAYREVFHQDAVGLRYKLREYCERLMFYNPLYYGKKAEEVLWRKVFYDIIQLIKHNRWHVRVGSSLETAYRTHLSSACGYYNHLLFRLQKDFNLKLDGKIDFHLLPDNNPGRYGKSSRRKEVSPAMYEWAMKAVHRCLICLGDIARYQQDFDSGMSGVSAERFYQQSLMLFPEIGLAHNQLGTLASSRYFNCEAVYHYIRCLSCDVPFEGAEGNLQRLFEKNQKKYADITKESSKQAYTPQEQCYHDLKAFFVRFLHLLKIFYDPPTNTDTHEIQESCQTVLQSFNHCMFYEPVVYSDDLSEENLHFMEDDIVFKIVVICIATVYILQKRGSRKVTAATAFLLALFSHILNHVVIRLQGALYERENPNKILQSLDHQYDTLLVGECNDEDSESDKNSLTDVSVSNGHVKQKKFTPNHSNNIDHKDSTKPKKPKSRMHNLRRRRPKSARAVESDDSDLSDLSDLSEGGDYPRDDLISDESEDEPVVGFYDDSDSDLSDSLMKSQEHEPGFATNPEADGSSNNENLSTNQNSSNLLSSMFMGKNSEQGNNIWSDLPHTESLATFSSELFSTSVPFLGTSFKLSHQVDDFNNDVIQGTKQVSVPPGFACTSEAKHVEEISQKLANFKIETDTEACLTASEAECSADSEEEKGDADSGEETEKLMSSEEDKEAIHTQNIIEVLQGEGLMSVVKVMCDWMRCNSKVIMTCAQSSQSVWCRLSVLLNFLPHESVYVNHEQCWQEELKAVLGETKLPKWKQVISLQEDVCLKKLPPLKEVHDTLDKRNSVRLTELQESFLRTCCLRQFGYFLSGLEGMQFSYNEEKRLFIGPAQAFNGEDTQEVAMEKMVDTESRRNQLMRDMAQLRLQAEVSQLEGSLSMSDHMPFPPYLIPDASSLCSALPLMKKLCQTNRSILVIPLAVIDSLDVQKKESHGAREAIRWLEAEFRKGNRYIRAQKSSEKLQASIPRHLKKKNREIWCALEILYCALYLSRQGGDFGAGTVIAILTTGNFTAIKHQQVKQAMSTSLQEGVSVENITEFMAKWSEVLNKS